MEEPPTTSVSRRAQAIDYGRHLGRRSAEVRPRHLMFTRRTKIITHAGLTQSSRFRACATRRLLPVYLQDPSKPLAYRSIDAPSPPASPFSATASKRVHPASLTKGSRDDFLSIGNPRNIDPTSSQPYNISTFCTIKQTRLPTPETIIPRRLHIPCPLRYPPSTAPTVTMAQPASPTPHPHIPPSTQYQT
jgi:hypothetical protein